MDEFPDYNVMVFNTHGTNFINTGPYTFQNDYWQGLHGIAGEVEVEYHERLQSGTVTKTDWYKIWLFTGDGRFVNKGDGGDWSWQYSAKGTTRNGGIVDFSRTVIERYTPLLSVAASFGKCADAKDRSNNNGTPIQLWDCTGDYNQKWQIIGSSLQTMGKCLDVPRESGGGNGATVQLWDCNGGDNQQWMPTAKDTIGLWVNAWSGKCLDLPGGNTWNGTRLQIWDCNGGPNQMWSH
ncbi:ricin-type beta-trefoil lectin domain protein [Streptomyces sp. cg36]|uniref:ricin-type beta-trefoil lectin domain protein n=1 Tax=Streptomyces sp. cg36 TaxID=3238798 RepID=UPI0034E26D13